MCQVFGNIASVPEQKTSKLGKNYFQYRLAESQRGIDNSPVFYTVRVFNKDENPNLALGDFVRVTGKLKADFYIGRDGKPSGTLLIIAFDAMKIAKPSANPDESKGKQPWHQKLSPRRKSGHRCKGQNGCQSQCKRWFSRSLNQTGPGFTTDLPD